MCGSQSDHVVLVVEDEALLRLYATDILTDAGFDVVEAANAEIALEKVRDHPEVTVLFTDVSMPGAFDGLELARRVHQVRPNVHLIVTSAHTHRVMETMPEVQAFLLKPYDPRQLPEIIRGLGA